MTVLRKEDFTSYAIEELGIWESLLQMGNQIDRAECETVDVLEVKLD